MDLIDLPEADLSTVADLVRTREVSPVELVDAQLDRIAARDPELGSYVTVLADQARDQARARTREVTGPGPLGPLHGIPVAVKDVIDVAGVPTGAGMPLRRDHRATVDADVVAALRWAGAVVLGKTVLTEGAYAEYHAPYRAPINPWDPAAWAGASSSGSGVAVAAGLCFGALGTDTGASIRFPSAVNGVTGLRPTWGTVAADGVFELAASLDTVGPMARTAHDVELLMRALAGWSGDAGPTTLSGRRIGLDPAMLSGSDADTAAGLRAVLQTAAELGAEPVELTFPSAAEGAVRDWLLMCGVEAARAHAGTFPRDRSGYGSALAALLDAGRGVSAAELAAAVRRRTTFSRAMEQLLGSVDVVLTPVLPVAGLAVADLVGLDADSIAALHRFTAPLAMSGQPALVLPVGSTGAGRPIAVQLVAARGRDRSLVAVADAIQQCTDWHRRALPGQPVATSARPASPGGSW